MTTQKETKANLKAWIKHYWSLLILAGLIVWVLIPPSMNKLSWEEDVQLQNGQMLTIKRTHWFDHSSGTSFAGVHDGPGVPLNSQIEFVWEGQQLLWEEQAYPLILQVDRQQLVLVSLIYKCEAFRQYGRPFPGYLIQRYENGIWWQVDIADLRIPDESNLLLNVLEFGKRKRWSIEDKKRVDYYGYAHSMLKLDKNFRSGC